MKNPATRRDFSRLRIIAFIAALPALTLTHCKSDDPGANEPGSSNTDPSRTHLRESEFANDESLAALPGQHIVLDLEPADGPRENVFRYLLPSGPHRFCVDGELTRLTVQGPDGTTLADLDPQTGCAELPIEAGTHRVGAWHDGTADTAKALTADTASSARTRVAFASAPERRVPLLTGCPDSVADATKCTPKKGYWPLLLDPKTDPTGQNRGGRLVQRATPKLSDETYCPCKGKVPCSKKPLVADFTSQQVTEDSLFDFGSPQVDQATRMAPHVFALKAPLTFDGSCINQSQLPLQSDESGYEVNNFDTNSLHPDPHFQRFWFDFGLYVNDLARMGGASYTMSLDAVYKNDLDEITSRGFAFDRASVLIYASYVGGGTRFTVPFRFLPAGTPLDLEEGEIALFQECNYQGNAMVFVADTNFAPLTTPGVNVDDSTRSVKVSNDTAAILFPDADYKGTPLVLEVDTPCLDTPTASSLQVRSLVPLLLFSHACPGCDLNGVDLTGANLACGEDLTKCANLRGANLTGAHLDGANLSGAHLENAVLDRATLTKAIMKGTHLDSASLKQAVLTSAQLHEASLVNADLSGATLELAQLNGAKLIYAELSGSNMSNALLNADSTLTPPVLTGAKLEGAHLKNVNLSGAQLGEADFKRASFYGDSAAGDNDNPCDILASGFTDGCASATLASANGADFTQAFLYGVDFAGASLTNAKFDNAVLVATNFADAKITATAAEAGFSFAHLQGAQLGGAKELDGVSFLGAHVDFEDENTLHVKLVGDYANFRGWKTPGQKICAVIDYDSPTTMPPQVSSTITCPDPVQAPPGCGPQTAENTHWASKTPPDQTDPPVWYETPTTPIPDPPAFPSDCAETEDGW